MRVLIACEFSAIVREAFKTQGHNAWSCDLLPSEIDGQHIQDDVLKHLDEDWDLMVAHPPCTYLSCSGARWFYPKNLHRELLREQAVEFFLSLYNAPILKVAVENPIGILSTRFRKPDQIIHPYYFGHSLSKATCLWLKGLPLLQPTCLVTPQTITTKSGRVWSKWFYDTSLIPYKLRGKERSRSFPNIAKAMAEQWG